MRTLQDLDFAMLEPVKREAKPLRTPEQKAVIARKAIDRDAQAALVKEWARLDIERDRHELAKMQAGADASYAKIITRIIHKQYAALEKLTGFARDQMVDAIEANNAILNRLGLQVEAPF